MSIIEEGTALNTALMSGELAVRDAIDQGNQVPQYMAALYLFGIPAMEGPSTEAVNLAIAVAEEGLAVAREFADDLQHAIKRLREVQPLLAELEEAQR